MNISPFEIPKMLYTLQNQEKGEISYELDNESFVLRMESIPLGEIYELSTEMLNATRRIERSLVSKLNCMYFVARKVSLPSVSFML